MSHCPSCGRYVGPYPACPYCGARLSGRISLGIVKITAILLATVGLAILWFAATRAEVPLVQIGQAGATMNMAYVRLQGHCTRAPSYDAENETLSFWIEDDTGEMRVSAYRAETRQIIEENRVPAPGDLVEVAGTLRVREDFLSLTIDVPEQLQITRAEPVDRAIGTIGPEDEYLRVRVRGQVRSVQEPYEGLTLITVRDGSGSIPVAVSADLVALSDGCVALSDGTSPTPSQGQPVEVVAAVSLYRDTPQLVPASVADIVPLSQPVPIAVERRIGELTSAEVGRLAVVRGTVAGVDPFSAGLKVTLDDTTGAIVVLLWQSVYDGMHDGLEIGAQVQVQGEVSEYRGQLELIPELAEDVQVLAPVTSPNPTPVGELTAEDVQVLAPATSPNPMPVGELTAADVGRRVTLRGTLGPPDPFSAGVKFTLDDGTGRITLLFWSDEYERTPDGLGAGAQVIATGEVAEYQGELELTHLDAGKITVLSPGTAPQPAELEETAIGDVTPADVGRTLTLSGTLGEMVTFSKGVKFPLDDGSGTIVLLLWQEVYDGIPDPDLLVPGAQVEVVGRIDEYEGELEIIPEADGVRGTR
ncbi:MAG TPA: OB-fold nucleic acid binding domain-containing protein [Anaerolineae bacterium]|nr:OB-fold nucleic acid binding domain-containing protein [Anaerolineae bacterium]